MSAARHRARKSALGPQRDRTRIAQVAARFIAEHGISDWTLAKRKAARQLSLPENAGLPSNDEIEMALADHHALFGGDAHEVALRKQRTEALDWMRRFAAWDPVLVGGVAAGWAGEHSDIRIELEADDPKAIEIALASGGIAYAALPLKDDDAITLLRIESPRAAIRIAIVSPVQRRNRRRKPEDARLDADAVAELIALPAGNSS